MSQVVCGFAPSPDGPRSVVLSIAAGRISGVEPRRSGDASGGILIAGLVDLQVNGGWGHDFTSDPTAIWEVGERLVEHGVTSFLPTIVSSPYEVIDDAVGVLRAGPPDGYAGARVLGLHIEGPWLSPQSYGAHDPEHLTLPSPEVAERWVESGVVAMVTMAPELPGARETARILSDGVVTVAMGHTGATYSEALDAFGGGWTAVTHLYNQMTPFHHREPGVVGAVFDARPFTGLIADGLHCHPAAARLAWKHLGPDRLVLVSDAMAATGLGEGTHRLGSLEVEVSGNGPRTQEGRLAGSLLTLDQALRNLVGWVDAALHEVVPCVTSNPAHAVRRADVGGLGEGQLADLVLLDPDLQILSTYVGGECVFRS